MGSTLRPRPRSERGSERDALIGGEDKYVLDLGSDIFDDFFWLIFEHQQPLKVNPARIRKTIPVNHNNYRHKFL
jgi:hypothetical protein